jgi:murein L,D-transpeptidase YcbB/YkuD
MKLINQATLAFLFLLVGCTATIPDSDPVFDAKNPMDNRLQLALDEGLLTELGYSEKFQQELALFYASRNYQPVWTNDSTLEKTGILFSTLFSQPNAIGIPAARLNKKIKSSWKNELVVKELLLTAKLAQAKYDLQKGFMDTTVNKMRPIHPCTHTQISALIAAKDTVKDLGLWFASMGPANRYYRKTALALFYTVYCQPVSQKSFDIPELKKDSLECVQQSKFALIEKGYLKQEATDDDAFETAVMRFQEDHALKPDGVLGQYTRMLLAESNQHAIDRTILSLERWRWRSVFPDRYVWVNIPEYLLRIYYNDTLYSEHRVVVGKPDHKTPQLTSKIRAVVAMPFWTQPQSIASKEFLPAIQANANYAARNHYKVYRGEKEIDPKTINWKKYKESNFPFRIKQDPGDDNALGLVKFEFNNKFGVYIHDTPSKAFFNRDVRAYSHGCVRCDEPDSLAHILLRWDPKQKITPDSLDTLIAHQTHTTIALYKPVTIQIDYITVTTNAKGFLLVHPDVYLRDELYLNWMK